MRTAGHLQEATAGMVVGALYMGRHLIPHLAWLRPAHRSLYTDCISKRANRRPGRWAALSRQRRSKR